jgi:hypothetical protein
MLFSEVFDLSKSILFIAAKKLKKNNNFKETKIKMNSRRSMV